MTNKKRVGSSNGRTADCGSAKCGFKSRPSLKRKKISWDKYYDHMNELCHKYDNPADALIEMLQYSSSVELEKNK